MTSYCYTPPALMLSWLHADGICDQILNQGAEFYWVGVFVYLKYFLLTCLLESPFYFYAVRSHHGTNSKTLVKAYLSSVFLCNLATHPVVCFLIPWMISLFAGTYALSLSIGEIFAPVVEALLLIKFWQVSPKKAWILSITANLFSWWLGVYLVT